jgi:hypothetical protein
MEENFDVFTKQERHEIYIHAKKQIKAYEYMCIAIDNSSRHLFPVIYKKYEMLKINCSEAIELFFPEMHRIKPAWAEFDYPWFDSSDNTEEREKQFDIIIKMTEENEKEF